MNDLEIIKQRLQAKKDEFTEELSYSEKAVLRAIILEYEQLITIMDLHYFGTDTRQAGHYFWILKGNSIQSDYRREKQIPFHPESMPLTTVNGEVETFVMTDFKRGKFYCILAICGSPVDKRGGCKSVFWTEGGDMKELNELIRATPAAMAIINMMPFSVEGFEKDAQRTER